MKKFMLLWLIAYPITLRAQEIMTLNLAHCIKYAKENNIKIQQQQLQTELATVAVKRTEGGRLPTVSAGVSQSASFYVNSDLNPHSFSTQFSLINADWTVFNGFRNLNALEKAKIEQKVGEKSWEILTNDIALNVANTYLQVLFNEELVTIAKNQLALSERQLKFVQTQYRAGVVPQSHIADAEAAVAKDELELVQRQNTVATTKLQLKSLLQMPLQTSLQLETIPVDRYIQTLAIQLPEEVYRAAIQQRPEIKQQQLRIQSAEKELAIAKGGLLPTVSLGYQLGTAYSKFWNKSVENFGKQWMDHLSNSLSLSIRIPIFEGYQNQSNILNAQIAQAQIALETENTHYLLRQQIESAYIDATNAKKAYEAALKNAAARKLSLDYAQKSYEAGTTNVLDLETAKNNYSASQSQLVQSKYDFLFKVKVLEFYASSDWDL